MHRESTNKQSLSFTWRNLLQEGTDRQRARQMDWPTDLGPSFSYYVPCLWHRNHKVEFRPVSVRSSQPYVWLCIFIEKNTHWRNIWQQVTWVKESDGWSGVQRRKGGSKEAQGWSPPLWRSNLSSSPPPPPPQCFGREVVPARRDLSECQLLFLEREFYNGYL